MKDELENKNPANEDMNEDDLWSLLSDVPAEEPKSAPKSAPKQTKSAAPAAPRFEPKTQTAPERRIDGFFLACMTGVAAVSIVATLAISSAFGGGKAATPPVTDPAASSTPVIETVDVSAKQIEALQQEVSDLEYEVESLKAQLKQREADVKRLYSEYSALLESTGGEQTGTIPTVSEGDEDIIAEQSQAVTLFQQVQDAYYQFDREALETLIPQMDQLLEYLNQEQLLEYYLILEYAEQPSNG